MSVLLLLSLGDADKTAQSKDMYVLSVTVTLVSLVVGIVTILWTHSTDAAADDDDPDGSGGHDDDCLSCSLRPWF